VLYYELRSLATAKRIVDTMSWRKKTMRKFFCVFVLTFLFLFTAFSASCAEQLSGPRMVIEENSFDCKEVKEGSVIQHNFKVLNKGDQPLQIKNVRPG
jgi:hypothetical protein